MNKSVNEAKSEVDAFITNLTHNLGLEALKEKIVGGALEMTKTENKGEQHHD